MKESLLEANICFCLVDAHYDQCADPINTVLRINLPVWEKHREKWHQDNPCPPASGCKRRLVVPQLLMCPASVSQVWTP